MPLPVLSLANPSTSLCELRRGIPSRKRMFASSNISIAGQPRTAQCAGVVIGPEAAACSMWRLKTHDHNFGGFSKVAGRARLTTRATAPLIIPEPQPLSSETRCKHVIEDMNGWAVDELEPLLRPSHHARCWQPADILPDASDPDFFDKVRALRQDAQHIPDSYFVVLVGDMITEEALPSYLNMLNITDGIGDESGADDTPWARWNRNWTAEENRHGDLLNKYLYLTGRVDMRRVEQTIQHLIGSGFDPDCDRNPYLLFAYTSFQERATKISHRNTSLLAREYGSRELAEMCGMIAADEARHEAAYKRIVGELLRRDPDVTMMAFAEMMRRSIVMPAHLMDDDGEHGRLNAAAHRGGAAGKLGRQSQLFADYAEVAQSIGVYTAEDYADITEHLVRHWDIEHTCGLSGEGAEAQEYLMQLGPRMRRLAQVHSERRRRAAGRCPEPPSRAFSWVGGAHVQY